VPERPGIALPALLLLAGLTAYPALVLLPRHRRPWPPRRTLSWFAGLGVAGAAMLAPPHHDFTAHVAGHLLSGMVAPLLVCWSMPVTLALRNLPADRARRLARLLRRTPVRVLTHPVTALLLDAGGLWLLYTGGLFRRLGHEPLVHAHMFLAGCLLTAALVGPDPAPHRAAWPTRAVVLVLFVAAHGTLAKFIYAHPPAGVPADQARTGALLMYYGGDLVDVLLIVLLCRMGYRRGALRPAAGRAVSRAAGG
jgi:putative membrane protein